MIYAGCFLIWIALGFGVCWVIDVGKVPHEREAMAQKVYCDLADFYLMCSEPVQPGLVFMDGLCDA